MGDTGSASETTPRPVAPLGIIAEKLATLLQDARAMPGIDPAFVRTIEEAERLAHGLEPYIATSTTPESPALAHLVRDTNAEDWSSRFASAETSVALEREMLSGHVEGQFLKILIHAMRAKRVLEIGVFTGYSALAMAEALPADGTLVACELDPYAARFAERAFARSEHGAKIRVVVGDALASIGRLAEAGDSFDLIFIDADKGNYHAYFQLAMETSLLRANGLICVDNTLMQGQPYLPGEPTPNGRAIAAFNRLVSEDPRVEQVLLPLRDGLTLIRRVEKTQVA